MSIDLSPFWESSFAVQVHIVTALLALVIGTFVFARRKGTWLHRQMGKVWVVAMALVALSSLFIHELPGWTLFSPLHALSFWTLACLIFAIVMIRRGNVRAHEYTMMGLFAGGLVVAGLLTLSRDLVMYKIFMKPNGWSFLPAMRDMPGGVIGIVFASAIAVFVLILLLDVIKGSQRPVVRSREKG